MLNCSLVNSFNSSAELSIKSSDEKIIKLNRCNMHKMNVTFRYFGHLIYVSTTVNVTKIT